MRLRWIAIVQLWACAALATEPGKDFSTDIVWPLYAQRIGETDPVPLHVQVHGCDDVRLDLMSRQSFQTYNSEWARKPVEFTAHTDGTYTTDLDVLEHVGDGDLACQMSVQRPLSIELRVVATCRADGREATSRPLPVQFAIADNVNTLWEAERFVAIDANRVLTLGRNYFAVQPTTEAQESDIRINGLPFGASARQEVGLHQNYMHETAVVGSTVYVSDACIFPYCHEVTATDPVSGTALTSEATTIFQIDTTAGNHNLVTGLLEVPGNVIRMVANEDGSVSVLSTSKPHEGGLAQLANSETGWVLSRIDGNRVTTLEVDADSTMLRYQTAGSAVISQLGDVYRLHNLRYPHASQTLAIPGKPRVSVLGALGALGYATQFSIAPDARQWTADREDGLWLSDGVRSIKLFEPPPQTALVSTGWQQDVVGVTYYFWNGNVARERRETTLFFDRHTGALVGNFEMPPAWKDAGLTRLTPLSNHRFAATSHGAVSILDEHGHMLAATRMPDGCRGSRGLEELSNGRLVWMGGHDRPIMYTWDISMYQSSLTR